MDILLRGDHLQKLRLASGLVLFLFVVTHLLNHALGLFGVEVMESFQTLRLAVTRSWLGTALLAAAALTHVALAMVKTAQRQTWQMPAWEALQIVSGLLVPLFLIDHVVVTRLAHSLAGADDFYAPVLAYYWPHRAWMQALLLLVAWTHACLGLHYWLRLGKAYAAAAPFLLALAVVLPALALAGFLVAGRAIEAVSAGMGSEAFLREARWPEGAASAHLKDIARKSLWVFLGLVAAVVAWHAVRVWRARTRRKVPVTYTAGPQVLGPLGATLLEISRLAKVPHAAVCGGRARCSTCRVRIEDGEEGLSPPQFAEAVTLGAVGAPDGVRLACQIRPAAALSVTRLVAPQFQPARRIAPRADDEHGIEKTVVVMFLDVRGFTQMSEKQLPYDVVFLLNRFFRAIGDAIHSEGGWIDKYMGDGLLVVFGRDTGAREGSRAGLAAAAKIDRALDRLNAELEAEHHAPLNVGIGLHAGPLVIGRIGHPASAAVTVIGQVVNTAARLEALTKDKGCQLIISRELARLADWNGEGAVAESVAVRGLSQPVEVLFVKRARTVEQS